MLIRFLATRRILGCKIKKVEKGKLAWFPSAGKPFENGAWQTAYEYL